MLRERNITGRVPPLAGTLLLAGLVVLGTVACDGRSLEQAGERSSAKADDGCEAGEVFAYEGVRFSCAEREKAEEFLNGATRFQIRGDGCAVLDEALCPWGPLTSDKIIAGRAAGWTLQTFADADWVGADKLAALKTLAAAALAADTAWRFPGAGQMYAAISVAELTADPDRFLDRYVSFERAAVSSTRTWETAGGDPVYAFRLRDEAGAAPSVELVYFLCNPFDAGGDCDAAPTFREGDALALVHVQVRRYRGRLELSWENDSTEHAVAGCVEGFTRSCGFDVGVCSASTESCSAGAWGECPGLALRLASDPPNGKDDDCDGEVDENALQLTPIGQLDGAIYALARLAGDTLIAVTPEGTVRIETADPAALTAEPLVTREPSRCSIADLALDGGRLAVGDCAADTRLFDLAADGALSPMTTVPAAQQTHHVALAGPRLAVADWYAGVSLYRLGAGGAAELALARADLLYVRELRLHGDRLLALGSGALTVIDLAQGTTTVHALPGIAGGMDVSAEGIVAVAVQGKLHLLDLDAPASALQGTAIPAKELDFSDVARGDAEAADNAARRLAAVGGDGKLRLVDVTGGATATVIAERALGTGLPPRVLLGGDRVYLYDRSSLEILAY